MRQAGVFLDERGQPDIAAFAAEQSAVLGIQQQARQPALRQPFHRAIGAENQVRADRGELCGIIARFWVCDDGKTLASKDSAGGDSIRHRSQSAQRFLQGWGCGLNFASCLAEIGTECRTRRSIDDMGAGLQPCPASQRHCYNDFSAADKGTLARPMPRPMQIRPYQAAFWLLIAASIGVKLVAAQLLVWEADYVPLLSRGTAWLDGGAFPAVGTLSSVAAFNLPFLVWLQLPALLLTRHVPTVLIGTQLAFNLLATLAVYRLGSDLIDERAGMIAALLFTYSQVGISSAYTAWAQLLLPGFCVFFVYCLYRWKSRRTRPLCRADLAGGDSGFHDAFFGGAVLWPAGGAVVDLSFALECAWRDCRSVAFGLPC